MNSIKTQAKEIVFSEWIYVYEADKVINENCGFNSIGEKLAFLQGMFDVELFHKHDADGTSKEESDKMTYFAMLNAIINY